MARTWTMRHFPQCGDTTVIRLRNDRDMRDLGGEAFRVGASITPNAAMSPVVHLDLPDIKRLVLQMKAIANGDRAQERACSEHEPQFRERYAELDAHAPPGTVLYADLCAAVLVIHEAMKYKPDLPPEFRLVETIAGRLKEIEDDGE